MPPVAMIGMPALLAISIVPLTVVPPLNFFDTAYDKSLLEILITFFPPLLANDSISCLSAPTFIVPFRTAIVAGTAPWKSEHEPDELTCVKWNI